MLSPFHLKRFRAFPTSLRNIEPFVRERTAHAAKHAAIDDVPNGRFHHTPRRRRGKKHRLLCAEQRLKLWMNLAVKIPKIFATMSNQRTRKCLPGAFGNFNWTGNKKLVVRMHEQTSDIRHATSNLKVLRPGLHLGALRRTRHAYAPLVCFLGPLDCSRRRDAR